MKIAIVDVGWKKLNPINPFGDALGGSETWLIQISKEFSKTCKVDVYCVCDAGFKIDNLSFMHQQEFLTTKEKYDFVILNRFFSKDNVNYIKFIRDHQIAKHVYIQIHDLSFLYNNHMMEIGTDVNKLYLNTDFVTIVTLNEWHRNNLLAQYKTLSNTPICIPNGLDLSLFKENKNKRDNRILWSSCEERGLDFLVNDIYPLVKKQIPDFGIDIAGYNDLHIKSNDEDVKILGKLTKEQLYKEQSKHKVWFYPGTFAETFCITMLENVMNGCQIVSPLTYGMEPTIGYADEIRTKFNFRTQKEQAVKECANKIIKILKSDNERPAVYDKIVEKIKNEYNWIYSVNKYLEHFNSLPEYDFTKNTIKNIKSEKKILILTMSCNIPYFKALLATEKDTWAKDVIKGKYENVYWYAYTNCDKKHPVPCIDQEDNMIYVNTGDGLYDTYDKTKEAYKLIVDSGLNFDYVVRTNTSVYINVDNLIKKVNSTDDDYVLGGEVGYYHKFSDGHRVFKFNIIVGLFMGMTKEKFDAAMTADKNYDTIPTSDDVIISRRLHDLYPDLIIVSPNPDCPTTYPRYKAHLPEDEALETGFNGFKGTFTNDPSVVNDNVVVQLRTLYGDLHERSEKGHEFEHFYELYDALD